MPWINDCKHENINICSRRNSGCQSTDIYTNCYRRLIRWLRSSAICDTDADSVDTMNNAAFITYIPKVIKLVLVKAALHSITMRGDCVKLTPLRDMRGIKQYQDHAQPGTTAISMLLSRSAPRGMPRSSCQTRKEHFVLFRKPGSYRRPPCFLWTACY